MCSRIGHGGFEGDTWLEEMSECQEKRGRDCLQLFVDNGGI